MSHEKEFFESYSFEEINRITIILDGNIILHGFFYFLSKFCRPVRVNDSTNDQLFGGLTMFNLHYWVQGLRENVQAGFIRRKIHENCCFSVKM